MRFVPLGDSAITIEVAGAAEATIDEATHRRVRAICAALEASPVPGVLECVPAFASVAVHYDPARVVEAAAADERHLGPHGLLVARLEHVLATMTDVQVPPAAIVEIPVCYGGTHGPDLIELARGHGITPDEVIRVHTDATYLVYMVGFMPGFAYLGGLPDQLTTPRRSEPRTVVPAGSVGIGGRQTGVYPMDSPGGWHLIGRTPTRMFDVRRDPPTLLGAGDRVRFRSIDEDEFIRLAAGDADATVS